MSPYHTILKNLKGKNALLFQILANNIHFLKFFGKYCFAPINSSQCGVVGCVFDNTSVVWCGFDTTPHYCTLYTQCLLPTYISNTGRVAVLLLSFFSLSPTPPPPRRRLDERFLPISDLGFHVICTNC